MKISIKSTLPFLIIVHTAIWCVAFYLLSINDTYGLYTNFWDFLKNNQGEYYSTLLMGMIAFNIILSCRFYFFEKIFSGLDKVYVVHKYTGYFTIVLLLLHDAFIRGSRMHVTGFFSFAKDVANPLLWAFLISVFISALPHIPVVNKILKIPYHIWKYTHYLMGVLFLIGIYHSVGVNTLTFSNDTLSVYMYIVYVLGFAAFLYKTFFYNLIKNNREYAIDNIKDFGDTIEITMSPMGDKSIKNKAGQFAFFKFSEKEIEEVHPFTISNFIKEDNKIRLSIKSLGDWTSKLKSNITLGTRVSVDGPYGKFNSEKENNNTEIWIAGGIGITPFLAFLQDYKINNNLNKKINFVWSVKNESEAIYKEEIEKDLPSNINFILHDTSKVGYFKFENLKDKFTISENPKVYICGPAMMRESIIENAKELGVKDFHFEEFNFR